MLVFYGVSNGAIFFDNAKGLGISIPVAGERNIFDVRGLCSFVTIDFGLKNFGPTVGFLYLIYEDKIMQFAPYTSLNYLVIGNTGLDFSLAIGVSLGFHIGK